MAKRTTFTTEHVRVRFTVKDVDPSAVFLALEPSDEKASDAAKGAVSSLSLWLTSGLDEAREVAALLNGKVTTVGVRVAHETTDGPTS
jgi:hypothetical protein